MRAKLCSIWSLAVPLLPEGQERGPSIFCHCLSLRVDPGTEKVSRFQVAVLWKLDLADKLNTELEVYVPGHL